MNILSHLSTIISTGTVLCAIAGFWWSLSSRSALRDKAILDLITTQKKLHLKVDKLSDEINSMEKSFNNMNVIQVQHDKETLRMEGQIEYARKTMSQLSNDLNRVSGSLDGMWSTLQRLYPEQVPKRMSDRTK